MSRRKPHTASFSVPALLLAMLPLVARERPDIGTIIQRSVEANEHDWIAAPEYGYTDRSREEGGTRTYDVIMLYGRPYDRLVAVNGHLLPPTEQKQEQEKLEETIARRRSESPQARAERTADYERGRKRDHLLMEQLTAAMDFTFLGRQRLGPFECFVLQATPRPGYKPPNIQAQVLTGMRGKLWIDTQSYQWVKVEATVVHPVSIEGFLARVEPGTRFELEYAPAGGGVWLPRHFSMSARTKILLVFSHRTQEEDWYSDYHRSPQARPTNHRPAP